MNRRAFLTALGLAPAATKPAVKTSSSSTMSNAEIRAEMDRRHALRSKAMRQLDITPAEEIVTREEWESLRIKSIDYAARTVTLEGSGT